MFHKSKTIDPQAELDEATLRAMIDFWPLCDPASDLPILRYPLRVHTTEGAWVGVFGGALNLAVNARLESQRAQRLPSHAPEARLISTCLRDAGRYTPYIESIHALQAEMRETVAWGEGKPGKPAVKSKGWCYDPRKVLAGLHALGAPDTRVATGHFTLPGRHGDLRDPLVWCLSGTVARHQWRMWLMPYKPGDVVGGAKGESC